MRSPPGALPTKPPPTPMAKLQDDITEIDILLEASKRARESVADRARGLYEEHLATQRKFDTEMQRETLSKKPGLRVDHSLMFHLGGGQDADTVPSAPGTAPQKKKEAVPLPEDAVVPPPPSYATESEAKEWDDYYRYCARGALFKALDRGRMTELELGQELAKIALEAESLPRYGDDEEYYDETAPQVLLDLARIRDVDSRLGKSKKALYKARKSSYDEVRQRLDAYGPKKIKDPGMAQRMRDLGLRLPTGPALVQEALEEHALRKKHQKGLQLAPAPAPSEQFEEYYEEDFPETPDAMPEPELTAQEIVERQTRVAGQMRRHIKRDKHVLDPMHQLPADPEGLPRDMLFSTIAKEHTVSVDLAFPSLDAYRRSEHDVAAYFAPGYTAHLSELDKKPHVGGFWTGIRAETRKMSSEDVPSPKPPSVELAPVQEPTRTLRRVPIRQTALESFRDCVEHGAACLSSVNLPEASRKAMEGPRFAQAIATCGEALDLALDGSDSDRSLIAEALSQVCGSKAAEPILDSARAPTPPECDAYARVVAAAARREENFAYPASFAHLCAFCCVAAALEDAAADELAQQKRKSDRSAFEAERAYRDLVRAPPQTKDECLDWIDELHACGALSESTCGSMAEAIPQRKTNVATVVASAGFEADADACATYEALHESAVTRLPRTEDKDDAALLLYSMILAALDEARPAQELMDLVRTTAAEAGPPSLHKPSPVKEDQPEEEDDDEEPSPELLLVRAFRKAVREAGNTFDGSESGSVDFDAAFAALAGGGMAEIPPQLCAPLLRPFATHWGSSEGKALSEAPHDDAAPRKVAALLAASTGGQVQARSLELFLAETAPATAAVPEGEAPATVGRRMRRLRNGGFGVVTATEAPGAAAGSAWMLHGLVCPGRVRSQVAVALDDLPAGADVDGLPDALLRWARFDEAGMLTGVFA